MPGPGSQWKSHFDPFYGAKCLRSVAREHRHLRCQRSLKCGSRFATQAIVLEDRYLRNDARVTQDAQHGRHEQVGRSEGPFEIVALAQQGREILQPLLDRKSVV